MRAGRPGAISWLKIEPLEILIAFQMITENVDDVDLQVALHEHTGWYEVFGRE